MIINDRPTLDDFVNSANMTECYFPHWPNLMLKSSTSITDYLIKMKKTETGISLTTIDGHNVIGFSATTLDSRGAYSHYYVYDDINDAIEAVISSFDTSAELLLSRANTFIEKRELLKADIQRSANV